MTFFDNHVGHKQIILHLTDLWKHFALPHSLLLHGEPGVGKLDLAMSLASMIIGRQVFSADAGHSYLTEVAAAREMNGESPKKIEEEGLPLYIDNGEAFWLRPMKTTLKVEQWYTLLQDYINLAVDTPRVIVVEDFHTANLVMANAMLKTIEEPPANVYFIIVTDKRATVLPTIISRCMDVPVGSVSDEELKEMLVAQGITDETVMAKALMAGQGNPTLVKQLSLTDSIPALDHALSIVSTISKDRRAFAILALDGEKKSREELIDMCHWLRALSRDMLALRQGAREETLVCPLYKDKLIQLLPFWSSSGLYQIGKETLQAEEALRFHVKANLVLDGLLIALQNAVKEEV